MTTKPETKFWRRIKNKFTKITFIRIEAVTPTGLPDLNGLFLDTEKRPHEFWVELKVSSGNRVRLSPGQISVTPLEQRGISVYSGGRSLNLASQGLTLEPCAFFPEPCVFSNLESWFMNHVP